MVGSHRYQLDHPNFETVRWILCQGITETLVNEKQKLNQVKQDLGSLKASLGKPFEHLEKMQSIRSRLKEIDTILQKEQDSKELTSYSTYTECAGYIPPEAEIIAELRLLVHRPEWMEDMLNLLPSNVIEFPVQKIMDKPQIVQVEYKFETVKTKKGKELSHLQGCLF